MNDNLLACQCNAFDLNWHALWKLLHCYAAASGLVGEELLICLIHFAKVGHVVEEDVDLVCRQHCTAFFPYV